MAGSGRGLLRMSFRCFPNNIIKPTFISDKRFLYSESALGINGYKHHRTTIKNQFLNVEDTFRKKMKEFTEPDSTNMIFTEDLKAMVHLLDKNAEDMDLIYKMLVKFNAQNKELRFGSFVFGPVIMRALYFLDEPDIAMTMFKDSSLDGIFAQVSSYQILMDLLYNHGKYAEMREIYNCIKTKQISGQTHHRNTTILVTGACYHENSNESMEYALDLWKELNSRGFQLARRAITFLAALFIKREAPQYALEILAICMQPRYIDIRCLKVSCYARLDRLEDIVPYFRVSLESDHPSHNKELFFKDTIKDVEDAIERLNARENSEIVKLLKQVKQHDHIQDKTLHENICETIELTSRQVLENNNRIKQKKSRVSYRPSLKDFV